jgi:hypothetical protein
MLHLTDIMVIATQHHFRLNRIQDSIRVFLREQILVLIAASLPNETA